MTAELPANVTLDWLGRELVAIRDDVRTMRRDMDILIRAVIRLDQTVDALRQDVRELWLGQGDLRRRIEALEEPRR
jgi:hypothetical protein